MFRKGLFFVTLFVVAFSVQSQIEMGKWRTHFGYNNMSKISQTSNKVFVVSSGALFSVDKRDGSMEFYSKTTGLNGTRVSIVGYDEVSNKLLIIYDDGNIDFLTVGGVTNLAEYYNKQMSANKEVNHILFNGNTAFLSCNFGIITLNMTKMEIQDTYYIGADASEVKVLNTTKQNGFIYAVTPTAIYKADINNPFLINYESWTNVTGLPGSGNLQALYAFGDDLILLRSGKIYKQNSGGTWSNLDVSLNYTNIGTSENYLFGYTAGSTYVFNSQLTKTAITNLTKLNGGTYDTQASKFWFIGDDRGVANYTLNGGGNPAVNFFKPDGPIVNTPDFVKFAGEKLFVLPGEKVLAPAQRAGHIMIFENNVWNNITRKIIEQSVPTNIRIEDFCAITIDPADNSHYFLNSASSGILEFRNDQFYQLFNRYNSNIKTALDLAPDFYQWTDNVLLDESGNIWFTNDLTSEGLKVRMADGTWIGFELDGVKNIQSLGTIHINTLNKNHKWILSTQYTPGICIFDDNGSIANKSDDRSVFYSSFNYTTSDGVKTVFPAYFNCIAQDKNGTMWVGTNKGPLLIPNTLKAFDNDFMASRIIIPRNDGTGLGDYLLEEQNITAIAIDGANRKWLGTEGAGVYLMSENGQETIHHFTTKNSPLLSDIILSIDINPVTGEVYFGTGAGLVSFQSDAANAGKVFKNVHVYPNPVRENFTGVITVTGLVENTIVKFTDVAGNLINETKSNGSIATWDGTDKYGQRVNTGVYLAICISEDGQESKTVKILIIN